MRKVALSSSSVALTLALSEQNGQSEAVADQYTRIPGLCKDCIDQ